MVVQSIKRRDRVILVLWVAALLALLICGRLHERQSATETAFSTAAANKVVTIDPGHGGFDAGAVDHGLTEKDLNLDVARCLRGYLEQAGAVVFMTRDEDVSTAPKDEKGVHAKKSDLDARKSVARDSGSDLLVSIHMNKFPQEQYRGAQVFYAEQPQESQMLAECIQTALSEILDDGNTRKAKRIDRDVLILRDAVIPSVIVECGFLSNPEEAERLGDEAYRQKLAWGIYLGMVRYFHEAF